MKGTKVNSPKKRAKQPDLTPKRLKAAKAAQPCIPCQQKKSRMK